MKTLSLTVVTAVLLLSAQSALSQSMRCGTNIVQGGSMTGKYEVTKKCGAPTQRYGNTWIYEKPGQPRYVVKFKDNGQISSITRARRFQ